MFSEFKDNDSAYDNAPVHTSYIYYGIPNIGLVPIVVCFVMIKTPDAFTMAYGISNWFDRFQHRRSPPVTLRLLKNNITNMSFTFLYRNLYNPCCSRETRFR